MAINPLQFQHNGKTYVIKSITQKQGTSEIKLDPSTLSQPELDACVAQARRVMDVVSRLANKPQDLNTPHSFTLHITQNLQSPSLTQLTLGRIFKRFAWKPQDATLKIVYKETAASEEKTFKLPLDSYDPAARADILGVTNELNDVVGIVIQSRQTNPQLHGYTPPNSSSASSSSSSSSSGSSSTPSTSSSSFSGTSSSTTTSTSSTSFSNSLSSAATRVSRSSSSSSSSPSSTTTSTSSSSSSSSPVPQLDPILVMAALLPAFYLMTAGSPATPASASEANPPPNPLDDVD